MALLYSSLKGWKHRCDCVPDGTGQDWLFVIKAVDKKFLFFTQSLQATQAWGPRDLDVAAVLDSAELSSPIFIVVSSSLSSPIGVGE